MDEKLLTSSELAEVLGVSKDVLRKWRLDYADFPNAAVKKTRYYYYSRENEQQIRAWMKAKGLPGTKMRLDPIVRFLSKVEFVDKWYDHGTHRTRCLEWTGAPSKHKEPRPQFYVDGRLHYAYRWFYERQFGPQPRRNAQGEVLDLDHLCRNTLCCNPVHLELVTHAINVLRGQAPNALIHATGKCGKGHELTDNNVIIRPSSPNHRECRTCHNGRQRERSVRKREQPLVS